MTEADGVPDSSPHGIEVAEADLAAQFARLESLRATIAADKAKYSSEPDQPSARELALVAARHQASYQVKLAEYQVLRETNDKKRKLAQTQLKQAKEHLASVGDGDGQYESLKGALKSLESPADNEADYPAVYAKTSTGRRLALARWITSATESAHGTRRREPRMDAAISANRWSSRYLTLDFEPSRLVIRRCSTISPTNS